MADVPYPITGESVEELRTQVFDIFKDLYLNRIGGAMVGDVFTNASDVLELQIAEDSGLFKNDDDELDFNVTASTISNAPSGNIEATTVQGAINELSSDKAQLEGVAHFNMLKFEARTGDLPNPPVGKVLILYDNKAAPTYYFSIRIDPDSGSGGDIAVNV